MNLTKAEFREELKRKRFELQDAERTLKSRRIVDHLKKAVDWSTVKTVHYFEPIRDLFEVDISGLVTHLEDNCPGIELFTPRLIGGEWEMISIQNEAAPDNFDVIVVPMLGFDSRLHRIGYGGGYYDKFLATQPGANKIGVCFDLGKVEAVPNEDHDIALDMIITETGQISH